MARMLQRREKNVIIAGGIFLTCFLTFSFVYLPKRRELGDLKARVDAMTKEYEDIGTVERQYQLLKRQTGPVMDKVLQRRKDFDLLAFVTQAEGRLKFTRSREIPMRPTTYGDFEKRASTFLYDDKRLGEIVEFLKEIEKPENVIAIEDLLITPKSASERSRLNLRIRLATVMPVK